MSRSRGHELYADSSAVATFAANATVVEVLAHHIQRPRAVWIVGWHVAVPTYVFLYLILLGKMCWWGAALGGLFFVGVIEGLYGRFFGHSGTSGSSLSWLNRS